MERGSTFNREVFDSRIRYNKFHQAKETTQKNMGPWEGCDCIPQPIRMGVGVWNPRQASKEQRRRTGTPGQLPPGLVSNGGMTPRLNDPPSRQGQQAAGGAGEVTGQEGGSTSRGGGEGYERLSGTGERWIAGTVPSGHPSFGKTVRQS